MKIITVLLSLLATSAWAGDGGFDLWTCISNSGRTNLTIYKDNYSAAEVPAKVVFGVDGQFITYLDYVYDLPRPDDQVCQDDCTNVQFYKNSVIVNSGDFINMEIELNGDKATIKEGFVDPRPNYQNDGNVGAIELSCKKYHMAP